MERHLASQVTCFFSLLFYFPAGVRRERCCWSWSAPAMEKHLASQVACFFVVAVLFSAMRSKIRSVLIRRWPVWVWSIVA